MTSSMQREILPYKKELEALTGWKAVLFPWGDSWAGLEVGLLRGVFAVMYRGGEAKTLTIADEAVRAEPVENGLSDSQRCAQAVRSIIIRWGKENR